MFKVCTKCGEEKPATVEYFHRDKRSKYGIITCCKVCRSMYQKKYREENLEKCKAYEKKYREENLEKCKAHKKKYYEENLEKCKARDKKYREENSEKIRALRKQRREENPEYQKKYHEENPEYQRKYMKQRRQEDPIFRLLCNMKSGLSKCLSGRSKNSHTMQYVDKTADQLMNYLEERFTEGMTQTNYGQWHADHIRPLASFNFYQFEEGSKEFENLLHIAWNYTNLQPLWAVDNMKKGSQYEH